MKTTVFICTVFIGGLFGYLSGPYVAMIFSPLIGLVGGLIIIGIENE